MLWYSNVIQRYVDLQYLMSISWDVRALDVVLEPVLNEGDEAIINDGSARLQFTKLGDSDAKEVLVDLLKQS